MTPSIKRMLEDIPMFLTGQMGVHKKRHGVDVASLLGLAHRSIEADDSQKRRDQAGLVTLDLPVEMVRKRCITS